MKLDHEFKAKPGHRFGWCAVCDRRQHAHIDREPFHKAGLPCPVVGCIVCYSLHAPDPSKLHPLDRLLGGVR